MDGKELGARLKDAFRYAGLSLQEAQKRLDKTGVRGASHSNFYKVLRGETSPSAEFIAGASQVTGVTADWLLTGEGEMTRKEYRSEELLDETYGLQDLPQVVQDDVIRLAHRLHGSTDLTGVTLSDTFDRVSLIASGIAAWLRLPLHSNKTRELGSGLETTAYCDAALRAFQMLVPTGGDDDSTPAGSDRVLVGLRELEEELCD